MSLLFNSFSEWATYCKNAGVPLHIPVLEYESVEKGRSRNLVYEGLAGAWQVMREAVMMGLSQDLKSRSGLVGGGGKAVAACPIVVLSPEFQNLIAAALAAKEVNSCMGRVVAAPTAGASGILPGILVTLQKQHNLSDIAIVEGLMVAAGVGLIIEQNASLSGAVGGCQAETGSAAAMGAAAIVHCLGGSPEQAFVAVSITIQCMLGLVCDPVAGLVEVPCVVRNASAAAIGFAAAQMALAGMDAVIPADETVGAMGEIGQSMESRYKETAMGGLAATPTGKAIAKRVLKHDIEILPE